MVLKYYTFLYYFDFVYKQSGWCSSRSTITHTA